MGRRIVRALRLHDPDWFRKQLRDLAKTARDTARADRAEAKLAFQKGDDSRGSLLEGSADAAEHYEREIKRILFGETRAENLTRRIRKL